MAETVNHDSTGNQGSSGEVERGVNILTKGQVVIVDGAEELIKEYEDGFITREELYERMMDLDIVYIDQSKFKDSKDNDSLE
jgi:hypothetical protein